MIRVPVLETITRYGYPRFVLAGRKAVYGANPCERIKALKEEDKKRSAISSEDLQRINRYLSKNNPYFLFGMPWNTNTFIRPEELTNIRLRDINLKEQKIFIASSISKNRRDGMVGLNDEILKQMVV